MFCSGWEILQLCVCALMVPQKGDIDDLLRTNGRTGLCNKAEKVGSEVGSLVDGVEDEVVSLFVSLCFLSELKYQDQRVGQWERVMEP